MKRDVDVLIVGAGPAGALSALMLARGGRQVALLDKSASVRPKVCAGLINSHTWELFRSLGLEESFRQLPHQQVTGVTLSWGDQPLYRISSDQTKDPCRAVERAVFDAWLIQEAQSAGVEFYPEARVQDVKDDGRVIVAEGTFKGRVLIGADGRNSIVARAGGLVSSFRRCQRVAWQSEIPSEMIDDDYHIRIFPEGYYTLVKIPGGRAKFCLVLHPGMSGTPHFIAHRYFPKVDAKVWQSLTPVAQPISDVARGNIWLVGDAARTVEPISGEGIYLALATANIAARALLAAPVDAPDAGADGYRVSHARLYKKRLSASPFFRWIMEEPGRAHRVAGWMKYLPSKLDRLLKTVLE